jgi:hypothetical protein
MTSTDTPTMWQRSSHSSNGTNCVEVAPLPQDDRLVRDSKDPAGPVLHLPAVQWVAFVAGIQDGQLS